MDLFIDNCAECPPGLRLRTKRSAEGSVTAVLQRIDFEMHDGRSINWDYERKIRSFHGVSKPGSRSQSLFRLSYGRKNNVGTPLTNDFFIICDGKKMPNLVLVLLCWSSPSFS